MKTKSISVLAAAILGVLVLALAGCGGGGSGSSSPPATTETTTSETTTETTTESDFTTAENCRELAGVGSKFQQALTGADADIQKAAQAFQELADKAPSDIRADFQTIAAAYSKIADALQGVDLKSGATPSPDVLAKLQKLQGEIDQVKLTKAAQNIAAWAQENCQT